MDPQTAVYTLDSYVACTAATKSIWLQVIISIMIHKLYNKQNHISHLTVIILTDLLRYDNGLFKNVSRSFIHPCRT